MMTATRASPQHGEVIVGALIFSLSPDLGGISVSGFCSCGSTTGGTTSTGTDTAGKPGKRPATASQLARTRLDAQASIPNPPSGEVQ
jgi:hypothetical protein